MIQERLVFDRVPKSLPVGNGDVFYVYAIKCETANHFYIGMTTDLGMRMNSHLSGAGSLFTKQHGVQLVIWTEGPMLRTRAVQREGELRNQLARAFPGAIVSNGRAARCINGQLVLGTEETTQGRHDY